MAKLFSREYHELSSTWYFGSKLLPIYEGELLCQAVKNEKGNLILRFFAIPEKKKYMPEDLIIRYDVKNKQILDHFCRSCLDNKSCNHLLTVINYSYHYLSTSDDYLPNESKSFGYEESDRSLKVDQSLVIYTNNLLVYNSYWQSKILNGRILLEGIYDQESDKVRFYFPDYLDLDLPEIVQYTVQKTELLATRRSMRKKNIQTHKTRTADLKLLQEQASAFRDSELALIGLLQSIKCSHSRKYQYFTIYKKDLVKTLPYLKDLQSKVQIRETGEPLIFSDKEFTVALRVEPVSESMFRIRIATGSFYSALYTGNENYIFVRNVIYRLQLPFNKELTEKIFSGGFLFSRRELAYVATIVAKQVGLNKCYLDFDDSITIPKNYSQSPGILLALSKKEDNIILKMMLQYKQNSKDESGRDIPLKCIYFDSELFVYKNSDCEDEWFYFPYEKREVLLNFLQSLPQPDKDLLIENSEYLYRQDDKKDRLKKIIYEQVPSDWIVKLDDDLKKEFVYRVELKPTVFVNRTDKINWFEYQITYHYQDLSFSHDELKKFFKSKEKYMKLDDERLVYFSGKESFDQIDSLLDYSGKQSSLSDERRTDLLTNYNLSYLYVVAKENENIRLDGDKYLEKMYTDLVRRSEEEEGKVPISLNNVMRSYQKIGFFWMKMLRKHHLGGLLADDMGLGKTLQSLAILSDYYEQQNQDRKLSLVVCPKTLLFNWAIEIEKFHPNLTYIIYEGSKRERTKLLEDNQSDIIIVSYSLVQMDIDNFLPHSYAYIILDEAQHIKNPLTLRSKAVKRLETDYKLALTGTPVENNLVDLWSIFDFLMPGYLHSLKSFRKEFTEDNEKTEENQQFLSRIVSPFILRRKKSEVLLELPDKQEQYLYNRMTSQQERIYLKVLAMAQEQILSSPSGIVDTVNHDEKNSNVISPNYINILTALVRLRQICNHPGMVDPELASKGNISGKMELLMELIQDAVENRRKILVFSQFVSMLKLIGRNLEEKGFIYEYMDGKTKNRQEKVKHFISNDNIRIFLLTLKVGGLGLNLTAADTVIIVDPWWNPMSENQSIDRVYRIGQTKKVLVYKIITKGTVEEKILQLQSQKKHIFTSVVEGSQSLISKMSPEDIRNLFEYNDE